MPDNRPTPKPLRGPARPTPKLRSREAITMRYRQYQHALNYWRGQQRDVSRDPAVEGVTDRPLPPFVVQHIKRHIAACEEAIIALTYALNDYTGDN